MISDLGTDHGRLGRHYQSWHALPGFLILREPEDWVQKACFWLCGGRAFLKKVVVETTTGALRGHLCPYISTIHIHFRYPLVQQKTSTLNSLNSNLLSSMDMDGDDLFEVDAIDGGRVINDNAGYKRTQAHVQWADGTASWEDITNLVGCYYLWLLYVSQNPVLTEFWEIDEILDSNSTHYQVRYALGGGTQWVRREEVDAERLVEEFEDWQAYMRQPLPQLNLDDELIDELLAEDVDMAPNYDATDYDDTDIIWM